MTNANDHIHSMELSDDLLCELATTLDDDSTDPMVEENVEQHLSQKLSQLSTSQEVNKQQPKDLPIIKEKRSPLTVSTTAKRMKMDHDITTIGVEEGEKIVQKDTKLPNYLMTNHLGFQQLIQSILSTTANSFKMEDIQEIALLIYHISSIDLQRSLWNCYLQSGTGELGKIRLSTTHRQLSVWALEVKKAIFSVTKKNETAVINIDQIDHDACLSHVYQTLNQFTTSRMDYQKKLEDKKHLLNNFFTTQMEDTITEFIDEQQMIFMRIETESKIAIVEYDYNDRLMEFEFDQLKPSQYQLQLLKNFIEAKENKEKSKYEVAMLKQRLAFHHFPEALNSLQLPLPSRPAAAAATSSPLDAITDLQNRQNLLDRYRNIVEQTKSKLMSFYIDIAEVQMKDSQLQFDKTMARMRPDHRSTTNSERLSPRMLELVERRFKNIDERLEHLYKLKLRFLIQKKH